MLRRKINTLPYSKFLIDYGMRLKVFYQRRNHSRQLVGPIVPYRKVIDGILYVLRTEDANGRCYLKNTDLVLLVIIAGFSNGIALDIFKKTWVKLLKIYDDKIGINWTWQSIRFYIYKVAFRGAMTGNNPTADRSKLGKQKDIF